MNSRSGPPPVGNKLSVARLLPWGVLTIVVVLGVVLAFRYGARVTPLIDTVR